MFSSVDLISCFCDWCWFLSSI